MSNKRPRGLLAIGLIIGAAIPAPASATVAAPASAAVVGTNAHKERAKVAVRLAPSTWSVSSVAQPVTGGTVLRGIACPSATSCVAVGGDSPGLGVLGALTIQRYDGVAWTPETQPLSSSTPAGLTSVSCPTTSNCIAVGTQKLANRFVQLIERWNGTAWSVMNAPVIANSTAEYLSEISCSTIQFCVAVGSVIVAGLTSTLVVQYNGVKWSVVPSPTVTGAPTTLLGVSCPSATFCAAGGLYTTLVAPGVSVPRPWLVRWDGATWTNDFVPGSIGQIFDVSCTSPSLCVALDFTVNSNVQSIIRTWDGSSWATGSGPSVANSEVFLHTIVCQAAACTAAGESYIHIGQGPGTPLVATLQSGTWTADSPDVRPSGQLFGLACPAGSGCVGVGATNSLVQGSPQITRRLVAVQNAVTPSFGVTVPWSAVDESRLLAIAGYLGLTPEQTAQAAVGVLAYIVGLIGDPNATPIVLSAIVSTNARVVLWDNVDESTLATVRSKFVLDDVDAHRLAFGVLAYLLFLGGH